ADALSLNPTSIHKTPFRQIIRDVISHSSGYGAAASSSRKAFTKIPVIAYTIQTPTPNPHRFAPSKSKPPAKLRNHDQTPQSTSSRQFASTPRFSFGFSQRTQAPGPAVGASYSSSPLIPRQPPRFPLTSSARKDDVEDVASDAEVEEPGPTATNLRGRKTNEPISDPPSPISTPFNKRRRLDAISISSSPSPSPSPPSSPPRQISSPTSDNPSSPLQHPPPSTHTQFILSPKRPPSTLSNIPSSKNNNTTRPSFVLPPRSPSPQPNTLPIFSPQRRGAKYVPGGMASTVRDWVIEIAGTATRRKEEEWDVVLRVGAVGEGDGGRVVLIQESGVMDGDGEEMGFRGGIREEKGRRKWMLAGGDDDRKIRMGMMIGIRRPVWDVEVKGVVWGVGVDWGLLDGLGERDS
ncbi:MAG: hypothetical protein Q9204_007646, partial [Flavoplaca sp. TL-2023a]